MFNSTLWLSIATTAAVFLLILGLHAIIGGTGFWPIVYSAPVIGAYLYWLIKKVNNPQ